MFAYTEPKERMVEIQRLESSEVPTIAAVGKAKNLKIGVPDWLLRSPSYFATVTFCWLDKGGDMVQSYLRHGPTEASS